MGLRDGFSAEEWTVVSEAPVLAGARLAAVEGGGSMLEGFAIRQVYAAARELRGESALLDELVAETPAIALDRGDDPVAVSNGHLHAALQILPVRVGEEDVAAYKGFVLAVAQTAAEAHREGGFVGIGGAEVTEREQAVLDELYALLGATPD
jgi:hypothetical protein